MKYINKLLGSLSSEEDFTELIKGSSTGLTMKVAGLVSGQLFAFVVAKYFGADIWGSFSLALSVITIGSILGTLGLDIGILREIAAIKDIKKIQIYYSKSYVLTFFASIIIAVFFYMFSGFIASDFFSKPHLTESFEIASLGIIPFSLIKLNSQAFRGLKDITKYVLLNFVARYLIALLILPFLWLIFSGQLIVLGSFVIGLYLIYGISQYWLYRENIDLVNIINEDAVSFNKILKVSLPLLLASSLIFVKGWVDTIMVGIFLPEKQVGIYYLSLKLSGILAIVLTAVNMIAAPKFAETYRENNLQKLEKIVQFSTKLIFIFTIPLFFFFILFPEQILGFFGEEYRNGTSAFILLCIGNLVSALSGSVGYFMQMTNSQVAFQNVTFVTTILGITLNYFLIPILGIEGAALSTCISMAFWNLSCVIFIKIKYNLNTFYTPRYR